MTKIVYGANRKIIGSTPANTPSYAVVETPSSGGETTVVSEYIRDTYATTTTVLNPSPNFRLDITNPTGNLVKEFRSYSPGVCSVNSTGNVARIANGACIVGVATPQGQMSYRRDFDIVDDVTVAFNNWQPGSLAAHVEASIRAMTSGKTSSTTTRRVLLSSSGGHTSPNYVRNPNLFCNALDLTAITVYTSAHGSNIFPVVLCSPRHVIAGHVGASPGQSIVFKAADGSYEVRTVVSQRRLTNPPLTTGEDYIAILNAPITTIPPIKFLPSTWAQYLPSINMAPGRMPVLNKGWAAGDDIRILENANPGPTNWIFLWINGDAEWASWSSPIIGGDSNGPVFIPVNGQTVLLHCMNTTGGGVHYSTILSAIQSQMNSLSTAQGTPLQTLNYVDLSGFNTYP